MDKWTHLVVGVPRDNSELRQAQLLGELTPGMEIIARSQNARDAEIVRDEFQRTDGGRVYSIIEIAERVMTKSDQNN